MGYSLAKNIFQSLLHKAGSFAKFSDSAFFYQIEYWNLREISLKSMHLVAIYETEKHYKGDISKLLWVFLDNSYQ